MRQKQHQTRRWQVTRTFEPNRRSQAHLTQAYQMIVPTHLRIVGGESEFQGAKRQGEWEERERRRAA
jgi:hypothetical protein